MSLFCIADLMQCPISMCTSYIYPVSLYLSCQRISTTAFCIILFAHTFPFLDCTPIPKNMQAEFYDVLPPSCMASALPGRRPPSFQSLQLTTTPSAGILRGNCGGGDPSAAELLTSSVRLCGFCVKGAAQFSSRSYGNRNGCALSGAAIFCILEVLICRHVLQ